MQPIKGLRRVGRVVADLFRQVPPETDGHTVVSGPDSDEVPTVEEIANTAEKHEAGREEYNEGDRIKRAAPKILDRVPTGVYGSWSVSWVQSSRREWDRDAIADVFAELGREVPTKAASPQIKLTRVVADPVTPEAEPVSVSEPVKIEDPTTAGMVDAIFSAAKPSGLAA